MYVSFKFENCFTFLLNSRLYWTFKHFSLDIKCHEQNRHYFRHIFFSLVTLYGQVLRPFLTPLILNVIMSPAMQRTFWAATFLQLHIQQQIRKLSLWHGHSFPRPVSCQLCSCWHPQLSCWAAGGLIDWRSLSCSRSVSTWKAFIMIWCNIVLYELTFFNEHFSLMSSCTNNHFSKTYIPNEPIQWSHLWIFKKSTYLYFC